MNTNTMIDRAGLDASLERLDIRELEERMEVSPLLAGPDVYSFDRCVCEGCCSTIDVPDATIEVGLDLYPPTDHNQLPY